MSSKEGNAPYDIKGKVTLVGAGPGAPDLITLRGQLALVKADVIIYDDLANAELLTVCRADAVKIYVGKRAGRHYMPQEEIGAILVREALPGRKVVRLKGGDPLVFGRGGEEAELLTKAGIDFEIVPGVTAASAAGAMAGIPLTQRGVASAVVFVTGHECRDKSPEAEVDWAALARTRATLCIYMGARRLSAIAAALIQGGLSGDTPMAVVTNASLANEAVSVGVLDDAELLASAAVGQPALIIVGEVVRLREILAEAREGSFQSADRL
ncbi:MAG: uroporphyrin-III C-methyltransferase [Verrucomicrobia bacterium]|nr:uroporphyrin-III C-methyltransferase [Verrucomicrobiota bacterium]